MLDRQYARVMAKYNQWMNRKLYTLVQGIPDELVYEDKSAFFKSVYGTLAHIIWADRIWMDRFKAHPRIEPANMLDIASLVEIRQKLDAEIISWAEGLDDEWLAQPLTWVSGMHQQTYTKPAWQLVAHFFNHQTHHRAQAGTLLTQMGLDIGITDLQMMPELEQFN